MSSSYHVIVVGAGHAGCEAAYAVARLNKKVLMVSLSKKHIGRLSCNPAIAWKTREDFSNTAEYN